MPGPVVGALGQVVDPSFFTLDFHLCGSNVQAQVQNLLQSSNERQKRPGDAVAIPSVHVDGAGAAEAATENNRQATMNASRGEMLIGPG